ncbi:response regulator [Burkholderia pseudomallei]|uniref:response regulator n=2 Tax=Burkholderia pseudomallei TaxID=28450 RepID=UPI00050DB522|nr:response regulator [Burkholderia pseudomallei MSHR2543]KGC68898.1 response regulator [Burkholderia pseudomallei]KGX09034.1 response regulator [Burkholderia pseudomallei]KGX26940.1 response regulator [Burkholderia pseudomallei]
MEIAVWRGGRAAALQASTQGIPGSLKVFPVGTAGPRAIAGTGRRTVAVGKNARLTREAFAVEAHMARRQRAVPVAEGDYASMVLTREVLKLAGCRIFTATSGMRAPNNAQEQSVDLALMGIHIPEMTGIEATRTRRQREPLCGRPKRLAVEVPRVRCLPSGKPVSTREWADPLPNPSMSKTCFGSLKVHAASVDSCTWRADPSLPRLACGKSAPAKTPTACSACSTLPRRTAPPKAMGPPSPPWRSATSRLPSLPTPLRPSSYKWGATASFRETVRLKSYQPCPCSRSKKP